MTCEASFSAPPSTGENEMSRGNTGPECILPSFPSLATVSPLVEATPTNKFSPLSRLSVFSTNSSTRALEITTDTASQLVASKRTLIGES